MIMDFSLNGNEILSFGLKRLALLQVETSLIFLKSDKDNYDEAVHTVRKNFKKIRAILRLVRYEFGEENFKFENYFYRDIGRELSELRDSAVLIETFDMITSENNDISFPSIKNKLEEKHQKIIQSKLAGINLFEAIFEQLKNSKGRMYDWNFHGNNFNIIYKGLLNIYDKAKSQMHICFDRPTPENYHEWRKRVKYLGYSVRIFMNSWLDHLNSLAESLKNLSDLLGDSHDLNELKKTLVLHPEIFNDDDENSIIINLIDSKINNLNKEAGFLGERIYSENAPQFTNRVQSYYQIWTSEKNNLF